jgi:hypothetical protein
VAPAAASLTFIGNAVAAKIFLHERVDRRRWIAASLVAAGVALLAGERRESRERALQMLRPNVARRVHLVIWCRRQHQRLNPQSEEIAYSEGRVPPPEHT